LESIVNFNRVLGVLGMVVGVILFVVGMRASRSFADQVSNVFAGRFTQTTTWYIAGGAAVAAMGLLMVLLGGRARDA
jgi:hypothetical protein